MSSVLTTSVKLSWAGDAILKKTRAACVEICREGARKVLADAKRFCPVEKPTVEFIGGSVVGVKDSRSWGDKSWQKRVRGALRDSGRITSFDQGGVVGSYAKFGGRGFISKGVDTYYAAFVELGTPGHVFTIKTKDGKKQIKCPIAANPFVRNALKSNRNHITKLFSAGDSI
jgi:hypothetical protein